MKVIIVGKLAFIYKAVFEKLKTSLEWLISGVVSKVGGKGSISGTALVSS